MGHTIEDDASRQRLLPALRLGGRRWQELKVRGMMEGPQAPGDSSMHGWQRLCKRFGS